MRFTTTFLAGFFCVLAAACNREAPIDPAALGHEAGKRARPFYEMVTQRRLPEAAVFFSQALREKYPDPLQEPLLKQRAAEQFVQTVPRLDRVDWRKKTVYFSVSLHMPVAGKGGVAAMEPRGTHVDRWVLEGDVWYYDGRSVE